MQALNGRVAGRVPDTSQPGAMIWPICAYPPDRLRSWRWLLL